MSTNITSLFKLEIIKTINKMEEESEIEMELLGMPGFFVYSPVFVGEKQGMEYITLQYEEKEYQVTML